MIYSAVRSCLDTGRRLAICGVDLEIILDGLFALLSGGIAYEAKGIARGCVRIALGAFAT